MMDSGTKTLFTRRLTSVNTTGTEYKPITLNEAKRMAVCEINKSRRDEDNKKTTKKVQPDNWKKKLNRKLPKWRR